jgi:hypothetical protein
MDLWTSRAGYNQDIGIFKNDCSSLSNLVSWKESGGFAGTFSPNAAFVEGTVPVATSQSVTLTLCWKANLSAPPGTVFGAAGTASTYFSPTRLTTEFVPTANFSSSARLQSYQLAVQQPDNASNWYEIDSNLRVTVSGNAGQRVILGGNVDLWTAHATYNQDIGIFVTDCSLSHLIAWKESGGFAGTLSPNAAYVQGVYQLPSTGSVTFTLCWKANKPAPPGTVYGAAGTSTTYFSPTRLTAEVN